MSVSIESSLQLEASCASAQRATLHFRNDSAQPVVAKFQLNCTCVQVSPTVALVEPHHQQEIDVVIGPGLPRDAVVAVRTVYRSLEKKEAAKLKSKLHDHAKRSKLRDELFANCVTNTLITRFERGELESAVTASSHSEMPAPSRVAPQLPPLPMPPKCAPVQQPRRNSRAGYWERTACQRRSCYSNTVSIPISWLLIAIGGALLLGKIAW